MTASLADAQPALTRPGPRPILLAVDWVAILALTAVFAGLTVALVRTVRKARRRWLLALTLIAVVVLASRWAAYRQAWAEFGVAALAATAVVLLWWFSHGRRLPPPTDDNIRVWTKEDPF
jgi:hypothetical protein